MRWKSVLRLSFLVFVPGAVVARSLSIAADKAPSRKCHDAARPLRADSKDRICLQERAGAIVADVYHVTGVGGTQLHPPTGGWPAVVLVRLHGFSALESFTASASVGTLTCEQSRPDGDPAVPDCRLADTRTDAIKRETGYYEVLLPKSLLEAGGPIELRWIDQWR